MRRSLGIYIALLVILVGAYYYLNNRPPKVEDEISISTPIPVEYLFSIEDGLPTRILIESKAGDIVEVARNEENAWVVTLPIEKAADQSVVEAATGQINTIRILDHLPDLEKASVGLDDPEFIFTIQFTSGVERIIDIGVLTPTGSGYYANRSDNKIVIISNAGLDALIGLLSNPPYLATETPLLTTPETDSAP